MTAFRVYTADEAGALLRPSMRHVSWHVVQRDGGRAVCTVVGNFVVCIPTIATDADLLAAAPGLVNTVRVLTTERDTARADAQAATAQLRAAQAEIAALRAENARLTRLPWSLELPQDSTAAQAQALLDAFPPPLPAGPQCPECKAWYDDHGSRWPHAPGCSELTRYDRHDAAVWELRDAAYGLARGLIRTEAERDAARAEAARLAAVRPSDDVPRHLRIAIVHATRAFETGNFRALATINEDIQHLVDAAIGAVRREQVKVERLEREIWSVAQVTTSCPPVEEVHVRDGEPVAEVVEVRGGQ